ncbi:uncharacterized protein LOC132197621 [Neocloeon triangulifer]|uniref:uncharacterized protein LOC132197621 n=1 Tax=Neocloeon triangulifer TaxID=2078957 RepID=UPI00286F60A4|nr:uncharacterized protein LOC132197621 [Neocloeon triangulifer]
MARFKFLLCLGAFFQTTTATDPAQIDLSTRVNEVEQLQGLVVQFSDLIAAGKKMEADFSTKVSSMFNLVNVVWERQDKLDDRMQAHVECSTGEGGSSEFKLLQEQVSTLTRAFVKRADAFDTCCLDQISLKEENSKLQQQILKLTGEKSGLQKKAENAHEGFQKAQADIELLKKKLYDLMKLADVKRQKEAVEKILKNCPLSRSANLTLLSNGKMYFLSHPITANWSVANETCAKMGLHLATLTDHADFEIVWKHANTTGHDCLWWLSARNLGVGGEYNFRWHDGTKLEETSSLWREHASKAGCVYFLSRPYKKLNGLSCTNDAHFICQLPPSA